MKKYLKRFTDLVLKAYSSGQYPLTSIAAGNKFIRIMPIQGSETLNTEPQIQIQIYKRLKAYNSPEKPMPTSGKVGGVDGSVNLIERLKAARTLDWETLETQWQNKRELLLRVKNKQHLDYSENSPESRALNDSIIARFIEHEEGLIEKLIGDLSDAEVSEITALDKANVIDKIDNTVIKLKLIVDDLVSYGDDHVVIYHPSLSKVFSEHQGIHYQQGTNTFGAGFQNGFRYLNTDFFECKILNAIWKEIQDDQGRKHKYVPAAIIVSKQWIYSAGLDTAFEKLNDKFFNETYDGHSYADLYGFVNRSRIKVFKVNLALLGVDPSKRINE